jgi:CP family cyanate transporter-like MFS transporter
MKEPTEARCAALLVPLFILVALNLRPGISSLGSLLPRIIADEGLSTVEVSCLTTLPVLCFGLFGQSAVHCGRLLGLKRGIGLLLLVLVASLTLRALPSRPALFAGTTLVGGAIGMIGVLMPVVARLWFPRRIGLMMGVYTMSLCIGAASGAGLSEPLALILSDSWPLALAVWALPAILALLFWIVPPNLFSAQPATGNRSGAIWRVSRAWQITGFMATQSSLAFITFTWLPVILQDRGVDAVEAGGITSLSLLTQAVSALVVPTFAARCASQSPWAIGIMGLVGLGFLGCIFAPTSALAVSALLLGLGQGGSFALALTFIVLRSATPQEATSLSAMVQSLGSLMAAIGPFLAGVLRKLDPSWGLCGMVLLLVAGLAALLGAHAGRPGFIGQKALGALA